VQDKEGKEMYTCPNPSCGKVFETPLRTLNLQDPAEPYAACPYCLTKITEFQVEINKSETRDESRLSKEKSSKTKEKPSTCQYHLGYLSEREDKQQIPDECIVCKDLLECMLQKMKA
jgi:DNA-directed RNA polymerase subunit RPC12/RpoP